jgi:Ni/Fe-hydrogenase subunit HybB-like protein
MFEVAWCVTLYSTVLFLEFIPVVFEKFGWHKPLEWIHNISVPLMIAGVLLSTLHQSSLGSLYLIVPEKLYPLWYSPLLPLLFYISAIAVGLSMTIFESWHSSRTETWLFALEIGLMVVPTLLLYQRKVRMSPGALYACVVMILFGFIANRLNVAVTGMEAGSGAHYIPKWTEVAVTLSIVGAGFAIFRVIAEYFPIFEAHPHEHAPEMEKTEADSVAVG